MDIRKQNHIHEKKEEKQSIHGRYTTHVNENCTKEKKRKNETEYLEGATIENFYHNSCCRK